MNHNKAVGIIFICGLIYNGIIVPLVHGLFGIDISSHDSSTALNAAGALATGALHTIEKFKGR